MQKHSFEFIQTYIHICTSSIYEHYLEGRTVMYGKDRKSKTCVCQDINLQLNSFQVGLKCHSNMYNVLHQQEKHFDSAYVQEFSFYSVLWFIHQ